MTSQNEIDLAWLAGFVDGEGYIGLTIHRNKGKKTYYIPRIAITQASEEMLNNISRVMENNGIAHHISKRRAQTKRWKPLFALETAGFARALKFLYVIEPYLVGKRLQAQMTMAYIWSRTRDGWSSKRPYTDDEHNLYHALRELNNRGPEILNEHTPKAIEFTAKMCSELHTKGVEVAEMTARPHREWVQK